MVDQSFFEHPWERRGIVVPGLPILPRGIADGQYIDLLILFDASLLPIEHTKHMNTRIQYKDVEL